MSTRDREEVHWREMRKQLVEVWNRDSVDGSDAADDSNLRAQVRIPHHRDELDKKSVHTRQRIPRE